MFGMGAVLGLGSAVLYWEREEAAAKPLSTTALVPKAPVPDLAPGHAATPPPKAVPSGLLTVVTQPPTEVRFRGESLGHTPLFQAKLPAGVQTLEFILPNGKRKKVALRVEEGQNTGVRLDLTDT
jgi:hypothetical protein